MKKKFYSLGLVSLFLVGCALLSCSSGDDGPTTSGSGSGDTGSSTTSGVVPDNHDSGKNNNSEPDNPTTSGDTGSDSGNNSGNSGSDSGNNSGNSGSDSGNNSGNSGSDSGSGSGSDSGSSNTPTWNLVFEDNFEGTDSIPNTQYWSLAKKGDDTWNRNMSESYGQAYQKDGYLYLFGMQDKDGTYLTGGIETIDKYSFKYGQVKCRARFLRQPQGNHTGIWMMPETQPEAWPRYGEIDIMEHINDESKIFSTVHFWNENENEGASSQEKYEIDNEDFNVYGIVWNKDAISFTVNGVEIFSYSNDDPEGEEFSYQYPFVRPFYLILSQSLGGEGTWEGPIDNSELPAIFQIDWIKVWQYSE